MIGSTPSEDLRSLTTGERFALLAAYVLEVMPQYGYSGRVADFVICQAALETGNFRSNLLLRADNAFGMRIAHVRPQPRIGESNGYAVYATLRDSVADYFDRQRAFGIPNTDNADEYIAATVATGYAEATRYAETWRAKLDAVAASDYADAFNLDGVPTAGDGGTGGAGDGLAIVVPLVLAFGIYRAIA